MDRILCGILVFSMTLGSLPAMADDVATPEGSALAIEKAQEEATAPSWFKRLRTTKVRRFFRNSIQQDIEPTEQEKQTLLQSIAAVFAYMDQDGNGDFKNLMRDSIAPFVQTLTKDELTIPIRDNEITEPMGNWTLENLVVRHMIAFYAGANDRVLKTIGIFRRHSKAITLATAFFIFATSAHFLDDQLFGGGVQSYMRFSLSYSFSQATFGVVMTAMLAAFVGPVTQFVQQWSNRLFGGVQSFLGQIFNKFQPNIGSDDAQADANIKPRMLEAGEDGANFGGLTRENQQKLWSDLTDEMVKMDAHAPKLLRSSQSNGRNYVQNAMTDAQNSANFVFLLDTNLTVQSMRSEQVLNKYETRFFIRDEFDNAMRLVDLYKRLEELCTKGSMEMLNSDELENVQAEINAIYAEMRKLGVMEHDLQKLWEIQKDRAKGLDAIVTTTSVNELKRFLNAETNRNAVEKLRNMEVATYKGFHLQDFVAKYGSQLKRLHEKMNIVNDGITVPPCESLLTQLAGPQRSP